MPIPFVSPARTVLLIGDEALSIYNVTFNASRLVEAVPWGAPDFESRCARLIRQKCKGRPALLVNDMTDQHFKGGQRLPRVSIMDKQSVLERKLQVAFPNYPIRGALPIKPGKRPSQTRQDDGQGGSGGMYLFAAVPMSEQIGKTMEVARRAMVAIAGLVLLPVEAADMVSSLSAKLSGKGNRASRWVIFVGQHKSGALRQVITRDGQLAMTRMTSIPPGNRDASAWAAEVAQEFKATVSYLSRFGYSPDDGTDVIAVSTPEEGDALKALIEIPCNYTSFTVNEAARLLGMSIGLQQDQHFAEVLHAAWIGRKSKFILPMKAEEIASILKPRQYAAALVFLLLLGLGYYSWQLLVQVQGMAAARKNLTEQEANLAQANAELDKEVQRMAKLGFDVRLIQASIRTYESLEKDGMKPLSAVKKIGDALGSELRLDMLKIESVPATQADAGSMSYQPQPEQGQPVDARNMLVTMTLSFPSTVEPSVGVRQINDLQSRLKGTFSGYDVKVTRQVADLVYTEDTSGKVGMVGDSGQAQDYVAELQIRGPLHD